MATRNEIEILIFYVLGEGNRELLIRTGLESVPKEKRAAALRGLQDLGWIGYSGLADYEESYSLTKEGRRIASERPKESSFDKKVREHVEALRFADNGSNGERKDALRRLIAIECEMACWDSALVNCYELRKLAEKTKDTESAAFALFSEGRVQVSQNRWDEALESYLAAIEKYIESGDRRGVCATNRALGIVYGSKGDHASSLRCLESSLTMARDISDKELEAKALANLAIVYDLEGREEESETASRGCLGYFMDSGDYSTASRIANNLGVLNLSRERFEVAAEYFEKTISACRFDRNREVLGAALVNGGYCYARVGELGRSISYTDEAVAIFREPNDLNMLALAYRNYGYMEFRNQNLTKAFEWFEKSVRTAKASGVADTFAACCYEYGISLIKSATDLKLAKKLLKRSSDAYKSIGNVARARAVENRLAAA